MMVHDIKDYPIIQDSSQEPSQSMTSRTGNSLHYYNYPREGKFGVQESQKMMIHNVKDDPILQDSSQEPLKFSKYEFQDRGVLGSLLFMLDS